MAADNVFHGSCLARLGRAVRPGFPAAAQRDAPCGAPGLPSCASACTGRANALQSNHAGGAAAAPINLSLKRK
ncbi:hypothetical protein C5615_34775 [Burkholderia cepacia]|uniref:Uncharacterized protein n=1 Tax=Burkholderia cepacia TaxID=292 RepID=A0A2S8I4B9_BURCE|nr:hypothetical protein C5615_34775 [Burkholderia cepacia]